MTKLVENIHKSLKINSEKFLFFYWTASTCSTFAIPFSVIE